MEGMSNVETSTYFRNLQKVNIPRTRCETCGKTSIVSPNFRSQAAEPVGAHHAEVDDEILRRDPGAFL